MQSLWLDLLLVGIIIFIAVLAANLVFYAIRHEFEDCHDWFGQGRKLWDFQNNKEQSGNYASSWECLYSAVFRQKDTIQKRFNDKK